jgi:hypothetical protein
MLLYQKERFNMKICYLRVLNSSNYMRIAVWDFIRLRLTGDKNEQFYQLWMILLHMPRK